MQPRKIEKGQIKSYHALDVSLNHTLRISPVAQLVEHQAAMREIVSSTPAGPTLRVLK